MFNCHVEFPEQHPVPYVLQWEKKVGDTVRYRTSPSLLSIRELMQGAPFVQGTLLVPATASLPEEIRNKLIPRRRPNKSIDEFLVRIARLIVSGNLLNFYIFSILININCNAVLLILNRPEMQPVITLHLKHF